MWLQFPGSITKYTYLQSHSRCWVGSFLTPGFKMWFQRTNTAEVLDGVSLSLSPSLILSLYSSFSYRAKILLLYLTYQFLEWLLVLRFQNIHPLHRGSQVASSQHRLASIVTLLITLLSLRRKETPRSLPPLLTDVKQTEVCQDLSVRLPTPHCTWFR